MARTKSKAELEAEVADLQDENQELQDQLDTIADIVAPPGEDEDDDSKGDDDEEDGRPGLKAAWQCGQVWRQEARQVTDRALRYRAIPAHHRAQESVCCVASSGMWKWATSTATRKIRSQKT